MKQCPLRGSPLVVAIAACLAAGALQATTITVDTHLDGPVGQGSTDCSLRAAIASANTASAVDGCTSGSPVGDQIVFARALGGAEIVLTQGEILIEGPVNIAGPVPGDATGITINGDNLSRIFKAVDAPLGLTDLSLTRGRTTADSQPGGAIFASGAGIALVNIQVTSSTTTGQSSPGGGIRIEDGDLLLIGSVISGNSSSGFGGGVAVSEGSAQIVDSVIADNYASSGGGGLGFYLGTHAVSDSLISGNTSGSNGGGISASSSSLALANSTVSNNRADGNTSLGAGGGVVVSGGNAQLVDAIIADNYALGWGGGLWFGTGTHEVSDSLISGNTSGGDGGGVFEGSNGLVLANSTVSNNRAEGAGLNGGGVFSFASAPVHLNHSTIAFNTAGNGATDGVHGANLIFQNSLVVQAGAGETACGGQNSVLFDPGSLATDASCATPVATAAAIGLQPLTDNGGWTPTHALATGSAAIGIAGDCTAFGFTTDQRGAPRPGLGSNACDSGAFEFQAEDQVFKDRFQQ